MDAKPSPQECLQQSISRMGLFHYLRSKITRANEKRSFNKNFHRRGLFFPPGLTVHNFCGENHAATLVILKT